MATTLPPQLGQHLLHEGRLQRELLDRRLNRRAVLGDPLVIVGARGLAAALVRERHLQPLDLALEPPDAGEGREQRLDLVGLGLAALREQDDLVQVELTVADLIHERQQLGRHHGNTCQRAAELDLAHLDPTAQADFLLGREQMDLADLLEVEADWILGRDRAGSKRFGGQGGGFLEDDGLFFLLEIDPGRLSLDLGQASPSAASALAG